MMFFIKRKYCLILLLISLFSTVMFSSLYAGQNNNYAIENNTLTLEFKAHNSFIYQEEPFFIDKKTVIIDTNLLETSFNSLKFPCIAKVRYRVMSDNRRVCEKIVVKRYLKRK